MTRLRSITGVPALLLLALGVFLLAAFVLRLIQDVSPDSGVVEVFLLAATFPILLIRSRLELDRNDPFRLYAGDATYPLHHVTGLVEGAGKMATTNVHGGGGVISGTHISTDVMGNVTGSGGGGVINPIVTTTTVQDQFFIRQADGYVAPITLKNWDVAVANGHVVSAVWVAKDGGSSGPFLAIRNHSTRGWAKPKAFPIGIGRRQPIVVLGVLVLLGAMLLGEAIVVFANGSSSPSQPVFFEVFGGMVVGGILWSRLVAPGFYKRWATDDADRIRAALDKIAASVPPTPEATRHEGEDPAAKLIQLAGLRDSGAITAQDYEAKKAELLARM